MSSPERVSIRPLWAIVRLTLGVWCWAAGNFALGQATRDGAVEVSAISTAAPRQISLAWRAGSLPIALQKIYRRPSGGGVWGPALATLPTSALEYVDSTVEAAVAYEYFVYRVFSDDRGSASGYLTAGIELPLVTARGRVLLLVDNTMAAPLAAELDQFVQDLIGDGWEVVRENVSRTAAPPQIRALIQTRYQEAPASTRALILFGHVPVPYSGNIGPDGHPEHVGAWPADGYYADVDGLWTDDTVDNPNAARLNNRNVPGDGKFDQSFLGTVELEMGRIDLADLPSMALSETELLRQYLRRNHAFRLKAGAFANLPRRGLVDDHFGFFNGEAFASTAYRNYSALFGTDPGSLQELDWFTTLQTEPYLWAYGCGSGSFGGAGGIGETSDFANKPSRAVFNTLFGSYFGDWDTGDSFLRAPLAGLETSFGLVSFWAGRPAWAFHPMAMGATIGYCAKLTQNNRAQFDRGYAANNNANRVHIALHGDPTLRLHPLAPPSALTALPAPQRVELSWSASPESGLAGYLVARASQPEGPFFSLTGAPVAGLSFTDRNVRPGDAHFYRVQTVKLEGQGSFSAAANNGSGTYLNSSQGIFATAMAGPIVGQPELQISGNGSPIFAGDLAPNPARGTDFGSAEIVPQTVIRRFVIRNDGDQPLTFSGPPVVQISGPHAAEFEVITQPAASLPPGGEGSFEVRFDPSAIGPRSALLTVASNDADEESFAFALGGRGRTAAPEIALSSPALNATVPAGSAVSPNLLITNSGAGSLTHQLRSSLDRYSFRTSGTFGGPVYQWIDISGTGTALGNFSNPDDASSDPISLGFSFPFFGEAYSTVRVCTNGFLSLSSGATSAGSTPLPSPSAPGNLIAGFWDDLILAETSRIFVQNVGGEFIVQFDDLGFYGDSTGQRVTFQIILRPTGEMVFNYAAINQSANLYSVGIQDRFGTEGLQIAAAEPLIQSGMAVRIVPPGRFSWLQLASSSGSVPPQGAGSAGLSLDTTGLSAGQYYAELSILSDDADEPVTLVPIELTVTAAAPEIEVRGNGITISDGATNPSAGDHTDFGFVDLGGAGLLRNFAVRNLGSQALILGTMEIGGPGFALETAPAALVPVGGMTSFAVRFAPTNPGLIAGMISFSNNDSDENPFAFALAGHGLTPLESWRLANFGTVLDAGAAADHADPDDDGSSNLAEYGSGGNPQTPDFGRRPAVGYSAEGYLQIQFTRNSNANDLNYWVEASGDLLTWTPIAQSLGGAAMVSTGAHAVDESGAGLLKIVVVQDNLPATGQAQRFLRVRQTRR